MTSFLHFRESPFPGSETQKKSKLNGVNWFNIVRILHCDEAVEFSLVCQLGLINTFITPDK